MKAWILEKQAPIEERPLVLRSVPTPELLDGEVLMKTLACGICRTDIHIAEGDLPLKESPIILGHEIVGMIEKVGRGVQDYAPGDLVGVYWLHDTCGKCKFCLSNRENYCPHIRCTGWDVDGGFAEYVTAPAAYCVSLNGVKMDPVEIAPLLCPGIAGYAAFNLSGAKAGDRLGLFGFGPTATYVLMVARYLGIEVYASTRSAKNIEAARRAGATWASDAAKDALPCALDAAILFPPAGNLVEPILQRLKRGGTLVMAPVSASPIEIKDYSQNLWGREIKTLYHLKRSDAVGFFKFVRKLDLKMDVSRFSFEELPDALIRTRRGKLEHPNAVIDLTG